MRACVQRVVAARVEIDGEVVGRIGPGLLVFLGVAQGDDEAAAVALADKIANLRVFEDAEGKMNRSLVQAGGSLLVVSQFTLLGDCRHGRRPSFALAAVPDVAERLYEHFVATARGLVTVVETGRFRAMMQVSLTNDGPVTLLLDSNA